MFTPREQKDSAGDLSESVPIGLEFERVGILDEITTRFRCDGCTVSPSLIAVTRHTETGVSIRKSLFSLSVEKSTDPRTC